jgi:SAM-dependent methyltransferase
MSYCQTQDMMRTYDQRLARKAIAIVHPRQKLAGEMSKFDDPSFFGDVWADVYDRGPGHDPTAAVEFLAGLADKGRVLELAIGTGRVGLPLARRGLAVEGLEASQKMVDLLRAKPDGSHIRVTLGDMADVQVTGPFELVYLVYNTFFNLLYPERQAACFRNVARVLEPGGAFVLECYVPDPPTLDQGQSVRAREVTEDSATIDVESYDAAAQRFARQRITIDSQGIRMRPHAERYCWPNELDLMAAQAGLRLAERYADWDRRPFGARSRDHVSVYRSA